MNTASDSWKKNIPLATRMRICIRDWHIKHIHNPYATMRRKKGWADGDLFKHIKIQTNYQCTRRCSYCHYGLEEPPTNIEMNESLYYSIFDQLKAFSYKGIVSLYEINEPLTDKRFYKFMKYARTSLPHAWIFITTNGDLLMKEDAESFFRTGLNFMYLNSYDKVALARNRELIAELGSEYRSVINHIDRTYQTSWTSRAGNVKQFHKGGCIATCDQVYEVMYVKPTGKVYSCINDFFNLNEMGDLNEQTIREIWFGDAFKELRRNLVRRKREFSNLCRQCDYQGYSNLPKVHVSWKIKRYLCGRSGGDI